MMSLKYCLKMWLSFMLSLGLIRSAFIVLFMEEVGRLSKLLERERNKVIWILR